jgi:hypothetical protein
MEINGSHKFAAPPQAVWDALHNNTILKNAVPGADQVSWEGDNAITFHGSVGAGPVNLGTVTVTAQVVEQQAPSHLKIGINRSVASGTVTVDIAPDGAGSLLTYTANMQLSGAVAAADNPIGRKFVDSQIGGVFNKLDAQIQ